MGFRMESTLLRIAYAFMCQIFYSHIQFCQGKWRWETDKRAFGAAWFSLGWDQSTSSPGLLILLFVSGKSALPKVA